MTDTALVQRLRAAGRDERLSTGPLYLDAADAVERLTRFKEAFWRYGDPMDMTEEYAALWHEVNRERCPEDY